MPWTFLCPLSDLVDNQGKYVDIHHHQLAVFLDKGRPFVMDNHCPHAGGSLAAGFVEDACAVCPWHYWRFHLCTGELTTHAAVKVQTYPARLTLRDQIPWVEADLPAI